MTQNQTKQSRLQVENYEKQNILSQLVCYRLDELFEKLEVDLRRSGKMYIGCCPIHCGDNYSALNLYPEGESVPGIWQCNTRKCHWTFKNTIIGFVRGVLSQKYFGWVPERPKEHLAPFQKVIDWLCKFIGKPFNEIVIDKQAMERNQFIHQMAMFKTTLTKKIGPTRDSVRQSLQIPAEYYLHRGYRPETLDFFDVGICNDEHKEMYQRAVVPIYDYTGQHMVGCTGRSIFESCPRCRLYHGATEQCPDRSEAKRFTKWRHHGDTGTTFYNWWNARTNIRDTGIAALVEGPGDVWKLWEAGAQNVLGMFGSNLTDGQQILLERSGAMTLYVIRDNDAAGEICEAKLKELLSRSYKLRFIVPSAKDVGEMSVEQVQRDMVPCLKKKS